MPLYRRVSPQHAGYGELIRALADELQHGEEPGRPEGAPLVIIEPALAGHENVVVVWDNPAWMGLSREDRGKIIMDAYDVAYGPEQSLKVMIAMGVTREEAERMQLPLPPAA